MLLQTNTIDYSVIEFWDHKQSEIRGNINNQEKVFRNQCNPELQESHEVRGSSGHGQLGSRNIVDQMCQKCVMIAVFI